LIRQTTNLSFETFSLFAYQRANNDLRILLGLRRPPNIMHPVVKGHSHGHGTIFHLDFSNLLEKQTFGMQVEILTDDLS
jgi:hypothetical protein